MKINSLTSAEENLMKLFWKLDSFYLKDVMEHHPEPKPHQNTVSTYLKILVEKEFLSTEKEGRIFKYSVVVPLSEYKKFLVKQLSDNFFENSGEEILELLMNEKLISQNDLKKYFDLKIEIKPIKEKAPKLELANEILNPVKKEKKLKDIKVKELVKEKKEDKEKDKKKKDKKKKNKLL